VNDLQHYISAFSDIVRGAPPASCADMCFFKVVLRGGPSAATLARLVREHRPAEVGAVNIFDHCEHGYLELRAWLGSEELALRLMGMGSLLGLWQLLTPKTVLGNYAGPELVDELVGVGMVTIIVPR
jgi:hypothetical protein